MKIAVLGANGQLGRDLCPRLAGEVVPLTRAEIDLDRPETIAAYLSANRPDVVINCAAYNFVDKAEDDPDAAFRVNAWGVRALARACRDANSRLVHVSTDYVFGLDETRTTPFREDDPPGPVSVYGLSKLSGEYVVRSTCPAHLVIRTCGLYGVWGSGGKGGNFVETMLRVAGQGKPLKVVNDQRCTPTYTADLAVAIADLVARSAQGLYHVTSAGDCTWYELAAEIFRQAGVAANLTPTTSAQFGAPARRPGYSVLACDKLATAGVTKPRPWQDALAAYLKERAAR
ncbi:dTDP-4-dehydrorhamnose reductase [Fimbriiglobus ruber]|nr:dTDP-4-dehydrorhamnose reductase [Fimbriiglobus ruber]